MPLNNVPVNALYCFCHVNSPKMYPREAWDGKNNPEMLGELGFQI